MKRTRTFVMVMLAAVMLAAAGCSSKNAEAPKTETKIETTAPDTEAAAETEDLTETEMETEDLTEATTKTEAVAKESETQQGEKQQFKGTLNKNKGFMFTVTSDADNEAYVFNLSDEKLLDGFKAGDKIVITYTGETPELTEATDTVVVKVEKQ